MSIVDPSAELVTGPTIGPAGRDRRRRQGRPLRRRRLKRFVRNPLAMVGLGFIVFLVLVAIFAPWIAPYSIPTSLGTVPGAAVVGALVRNRPSSVATCSPRVVYGARCR